MTPEGKVKQRVKRLLEASGAYYHMPVQNGMGAPTLDFTGCHAGRYFAVETKAGGNTLTPRQQQTARAIAAARGAVFVVSDVTGYERLNAWLREGAS
jgi:hypothetical protein